MTQLSMPWNGVTTGDATAAPYDAPDEWARIWRSIAGAAAIPTNLSGVFAGELNTLAVTGAVTPVAVATGRALVYGTWYQSDAAENIAIPTPSGATRIDRIVLRKDWALQTVRVVRIAGAEGGAAPPLVQIDGTTWDQPLAQVSITTGGAITVTDERQFLGIAVPGGGITGQVLQPTGVGSAAWTSNPTIAGTLSFSTTASRIIPGATSLSFRNNANSADNIIITDAGVVTLRNQLVIPFGGNGIDVSGNSSIVGTLIGLTGLTSSGNITFSGLTSNRLVVKGATNLESSISSANVRSSITDPTGSGGSLVFATNPTLAGLNSTSHITINSTASAWGAGWLALQSQTVGTLESSGSTSTSNWGLGYNHYYDGTNRRYIATGAAGHLIWNSGELYIQTAVSGTAGNVVSLATRVFVSNAGNVTISAPTSGIALTTLGTGVAIRIANNSRISFRSSDDLTDINLIGVLGASNIVSVGDSTATSIRFNSGGFADRVVIAAGMDVGGAAGGDKGNGTINVAADIYRNNTAYANPDYVFEHYFTGKIDKYIANPGADSYGGLVPLNDLREYVRENWRFPGITDEAMGMFDRGDHALRLIEMNTLYLFNHEDRITRLEEKVLV